jgi:zinc and cadmium transporter
METLGIILIATVLVGVMSLIGAVLLPLNIDVKKATFYLISLASGTLIGGALLHLIPEALETRGEHTFLAVGMGVFLFFIMEKFLIWRHCHHHQKPEDHIRPVVANMVLVGDAIHNFIDGIIIAGAFLASPALGISVTIGIALHEIPQELGDFGILIHGGYSVRKALLLNALMGSTAILGAVLGYFFFEAFDSLHKFVLPFAAGGFLYIAMADLIPQLHEQTKTKHTFLQILLLAGGFVLMLGVRHIFHH